MRVIDEVSMIDLPTDGLPSRWRFKRRPSWHA
jgi:hypothetical protein